MCIFSGPVNSVSNTRIFARRNEEMQYLVYQMKFDAANPLAMILPIPIAESRGEDAVKFHDLSNSHDFFTKLDYFFPSRTLGDDRSFNSGESPRMAKTLAVHQVGSYEASYVPTLADFDRVDERFKLPPQTWDQLPEYANYGFCVFKLNQNSPSTIRMPMRSNPIRHIGGKSIEPHPMAFSFPSRFPKAIFFPTVHIHDGQIHANENFDHDIYTQSRDPAQLAELRSNYMWWESTPIRGFDEIAGNILDIDAPAFKTSLKGTLSNSDIMID